MSEEVFIDVATGGVDCSCGGLSLGLHLKLATYTPEVVVIHSRGWNAGGAPRVYVPAQYHVFRVLGSSPDGVHQVDHVVSFKVRLDAAGPLSAMVMPWRPFPDAENAPANGTRPGEPEP